MVKHRNLQDAPNPHTLDPFDPESFLARLGIERPPAGGVFTEMLYDEVRARGADPEGRNQLDGFGPAVGDAYFVDEAIARKVLSADYSRYARQMSDLLGDGFPHQPCRIAELGCGAGLLSLWLARQHPAAEVHGFDWSAGAIGVARRFAAELDIGNASFHEASYESVAAEARSGFDLVIAYNAVNLDRHAERSRGVYSLAEFSEAGLDELSPHIRQLTAAMASLLTPEGVGVICGNWNDLGLVCLFHSIRAAGLGVNWPFTYWSGPKPQSPESDEKHYIFVRRDLPHVGASAWEDQRALLTCGEYYDRIVELDHKLAESYSRLFQDGETLAAVEFSHSTGGRARVRLMKSGGLLFLEDYSSLGYRRGLLHSMGSILEMFALVARREAEWHQLEDDDGGRIVVNFKAKWVLPYLIGAGAVTVAPREGG